MNDEATMDHFSLDSGSLQAQKAARLARDLMEARAANTTAHAFAKALAVDLVILIAVVADMVIKPGL